MEREVNGQSLACGLRFADRDAVGEGCGAATHVARVEVRIRLPARTLGETAQRMLRFVDASSDVPLG